MKVQIRKTGILLIAALLSSACTWVDLTLEAEKVRVLSLDEVKACKRIGKTTVSLKDKIIGVERNRDKVAKELKTLARNSGADLGGDTVAPLSEPEDGKQVFAVFRCMP